jgi:multiple antibiotic resistance protein
MHVAIQAFLLGFPALFSIVNPPSAAFIFREVTADFSRAERSAISRRVAVYSLLVLLVALWAGSPVLEFFGVSLPALRIAGGFVVMSNAWEMLRAPEQRHARKEQQANAPDAGADIAFYPLTLPFTTGPGTISVAVALTAGHPAWGESEAWFYLGLTAAAVAMAAAIWLTFHFAPLVVDRLGPVGSHTVGRLFAFLLLCIGTQILITGVEEMLRPLLAR